jgi:hypothetical protein
MSTPMRRMAPHPLPFPWILMMLRAESGNPTASIERWSNGVSPVGVNADGDKQRLARARSDLAPLG